MGLKDRRPSTKVERELRQTRRELLDTQELLVVQFEENQKLNTALLDTQELVASIVEKGGVA